MPKNKIGFMQGRLSKTSSGKLQSFPKKNWKQEFKIGKKIGFESIEWTIDYYDILKNPLIKNSINSKYLKILNISSVTCDFFMQKPFWKNKNFFKMKNIFHILINSCGNYKIKYIIVPLVDNSSIKNIKIENYIISFFKTFEDSLKKNKISILFESDFEPNLLKKFIKKFKSDFFGINYDIGNSACYGFSPKIEIPLYHKYIKNVHIKDRIYKSKSVMLGEGDANIDSSINLLNKYNYKGSFILQTYRSSNNYINDLIYNLDYFKKTIYV